MEMMNITPTFSLPPLKPPTPVGTKVEVYKGYYTTEQALNVVITHLVKQKALSLDAKNECKYRGVSGRMCALGVLIPDVDYDPMMECFSADQVVWTIPALKNVNINALQMMQYYHDGAVPKEHQRLSYEEWVNGNEAHHPRVMADLLMNELRLTKKINI
jgi:hypothetical protein